MAENVFGWFLPGFMEVIHVELNWGKMYLPDEAVDVVVPEDVGEDHTFKEFRVLDDERFSKRQPCYNVRKLFILKLTHFLLPGCQMFFAQSWPLMFHCKAFSRFSQKIYFILKFKYKNQKLIIH